MTVRSLSPAIVRQMDLHRSLRVLLLELLAMAHGRPALNTTQAAIANRLGAGERSVRRQLAGLEDIGLISRRENRCGRTGHKGATTIVFNTNAWTIVPSQPAQMAARTDKANRSGWPVGQPAKMAAIIEDSFKGRIRDDQSRSREGDDYRVGAHTNDPAEPRPQLRLLSGGRAA